MRNIKLTAAYDGTEYFGFQKTRMGPSVEEEIETVLEKITRQKIALQAASRTDAGVHAEGQVLNFFLENDNLDLNTLHISLNQLLPKDIAILDLSAAADDFHPTLDAEGKEYHYTLSLGPVQFPRHRLYAWHIPQSLSLEAMCEASRSLLGEHDFSAFCNVKKNETETDFTRTIFSIGFEPLSDNRLKIIIQGNRFLYRMARNIAGTLVYVGRGRLKVSDIPKILAGKDRKKAGITAPAHGLTLFKVTY